MAEKPRRRVEPEAGPGGRKEAEVGPKKIEIDVKALGAEELVSLEAVKHIEISSEKLAESVNRLNVIMARLHADLARLSIRVRSSTEAVNNEMMKHASRMSKVNRELDAVARHFSQASMVFRGFEESTKRYVGGITSMFLLPVAVVKGFVDSIQGTIETVAQWRKSMIAFDQAVVNSIYKYSVMAQKRGVRGRIAKIARGLAIGYVKATRGIPQLVKRGLGRLRKPGIENLVSFLRGGEAVQEQRRITRLLSFITTMVVSINAFFARLLRYVWEILVLQKLGGIFNFLKGGLSNILGALGLTAVFGLLKTQLASLATAIGGIASSIGSAVGGVASKVGAILTSSVVGTALAVVAGIAVAGKVAEALGVNSEKLGVAVRALANKAEEAEKHGRNISASFFRASSSIVSFAREVWIAGDQAKEWLSTNVPVIGEALGEIARGLIHGVSVIVTGVGALADLLGEGVSRIEGFASWVREGVSGFINNVQTAFSNFIGWASAGLRGLWEGFLVSLSTAVNWVSGAVRSIWDGIIRSFGWVSDRILGMVGTVSRIWEGLVNSLRGIADKLGLGGVFNQVSQAMGILGNMLQNAVNAIGGFVHALTGRNPGVIMHLEELGSALRRTTSSLYTPTDTRTGIEGIYGSQFLSLIAELINEVRELRRDVVKSKPEVNVSIKTLESAYIRR